MINISLDSDNKILTVDGRLDKSTVREQMNNVINLTQGEEYRIDLAKLETCDSAGLAYLINLINQQRLQGGDMRLSNCSGEVKQLIELSELDDILNIPSA